MVHFAGAGFHHLFLCAARCGCDLADASLKCFTVCRQVPFILLAQAFFYFCPSLVWHGLNQKGGMDADSILNSSAKLIHYTHEDARKEIIESVVMQLDRCVRAKCTCTLKTHQANTS